jgi:hypothetical protein
MAKNERVKKISTELSVGLTPELEQMVSFASEATMILPSIWARIAIAEKLNREGWPQIIKNHLGAK